MTTLPISGAGQVGGTCLTPGQFHPTLSPLAMHELLLHGQVPQSRHSQLLSVLAGVAAMQPRPVTRRHAVYRPVRDPPPPGRQGQIGGSQGVAPDKRGAQKQEAKEFHYLRLVRAVADGDFEKEPPATADGAVAAGDREDEAMPDADAGPEGAEEGSSKGAGGGPAREDSTTGWTLQFNDLPDAAKRPALSRLVSETTILSGNAHAYMKGLGYKYVSEYVTAGHEFVHRNVVVSLTRVLLPPEEEEKNGAGADGPGKLPARSALRPLDPSGAYLLEAAVRVQDSSRPDVVAKGTEELAALKGLLKGVVDLRVVDRLALDSRVKWKPKEGVVIS